MCARCKKVRDDQAQWHSLEDYLSVQLHLDFTHGFCPECAHTLFPDLDLSEASRPR